MPPKKQAPKNGFYFYMEDMRNDIAAKGMRVPNMKDMVVIAHPSWKALSAEEKEPYNDRAKFARGQDKITLKGKLTADGKEILQVQAEMMEKEQEKVRMRAAVKEFITNIDPVSTDFIFMAFNTLCATDDKMFIPNEVGIVRYSLKEGLGDTFHKFISPGPIPVGYTSDAKAHSEATHQIPISINDFEEFDENYASIYQEILKFANVRQEKTVFVYCLPDDMEQNAGCLSWLYEKACVRRNPQLVIVDITYLLMALAATVEQPFSSDSLADDVLRNHSFDYCTKIRCSFHDDLDNAHCALAYPQRLSFIFSDYLCPLFDIVPKEGSHLPSMINRNVIIETWKPKAPILPLVNKVNVPLKPVEEHPITTFAANARSVYVDYEDVRIVPSAMGAERPVSKKEPCNIKDKQQFPTLTQKLGELNIRDRQPKAPCPQSSLLEMDDRERDAWLTNAGRGIPINRGHDAPPRMGVGIGRGVMRFKPQ